MYTVTGKVGKRIVKFECPTCAAPIESPLEEAGQKFPCPSCGKKFEMRLQTLRPPGTNSSLTTQDHTVSPWQ